MKRLILLYDNDVVYKEMIVSKNRSVLAILIWLYFPDLTYKDRNYLVVDV